MPPQQQRFRVNLQIRVREVRLIDENNEQLGIVPFEVAYRTARDRNLDLVEVSPVAQPPVCRIVDYGKFLYQIERQGRKSKAKKKRVDLKGIRLSLTIGDHDMDVRRKLAEKFLGEGHKVKVELILRGRENQHRDRARKVLEEFIAKLGKNAKIDQPVSITGNRFTSILSHG